MKRLYNEGITIVFGENSKYKKQYIDNFLNSYPEFNLEVNQYLSFYKYIGPFKTKNTQTILKTLLKDPALSQYSKSYIVDQLQNIGAYYIARYPLQLTQRQQDRVSILKDVLAGKKNIILDDSNDENLYYYTDIIKFLNQSKEFKGGKVIWFTHHKLEDILIELGNNLTHYHFYQLFYQKLIKRDYNNWEAIISVNSKNYIEEKSLTQIRATLIQGQINKNLVLYDAYDDRSFKIHGNLFIINNHFEEEAINTFVYNKKNPRFIFYIAREDYTDFPKPELLIAKKEDI